MGSRARGDHGVPPGARRQRPGVPAVRRAGVRAPPPLPVPGGADAPSSSPADPGLGDAAGRRCRHHSWPPKTDEVPARRPRPCRRRRRRHAGDLEPGVVAARRRPSRRRTRRSRRLAEQTGGMPCQSEPPVGERAHVSMREVEDPPPSVAEVRVEERPVAGAPDLVAPGGCGRELGPRPGDQVVGGPTLAPDSSSGATDGRPEDQDAVAVRDGEAGRTTPAAGRPARPPSVPESGRRAQRRRAPRSRRSRQRQQTVVAWRRADRRRRSAAARARTTCPRRCRSAAARVGRSTFGRARSWTRRRCRRPSTARRWPWAQAVRVRRPSAYHVAGRRGRGRRRRANGGSLGAAQSAFGRAQERPAAEDVAPVTRRRRRSRRSGRPAARRAAAPTRARRGPPGLVIGRVVGAAGTPHEHEQGGQSTRTHAGPTAEVAVGIRRHGLQITVSDGM